MQAFPDRSTIYQIGSFLGESHHAPDALASMQFLHRLNKPGAVQRYLRYLDPSAQAATSTGISANNQTVLRRHESSLAEDHLCL